MIYRVVLHSLENCSAGKDGTDDDTQTRFSQHNVGCASSSISGISDSNTNVGLLQSWRIIHTISRHSTDMLLLLQLLDDLIFVLCVELKSIKAMFTPWKKKKNFFPELEAHRIRYMDLKPTRKHSSKSISLLNQLIHRERRNG